MWVPILQPGTQACGSVSEARSYSQRLRARMTMVSPRFMGRGLRWSLSWTLLMDSILGPYVTSLSLGFLIQKIGTLEHVPPLRIPMDPSGCTLHLSPPALGPWKVTGVNYIDGWLSLPSGCS